MDKWRKISMKQSLKRILALALALVFIAVTMVSAVAAGGEGGTPPDMPSGEGGTPPDMPGGEGGGMPGGGGGANTMTYDYDGDLSGVLTADGEEVSSEDGEVYDATETDQNAALAENGGVLTIKNNTFTKSGDDTDGDNCNFYGLNSIVLAVGEDSKIYLSEANLSASSEGSNGIFATDNATIYVKDTTINTKQDNSRGLDATYGGTIIADAMEITSLGAHCAAIATDRGGGNISVTNSTLSTAGSGSPLLYSTGDIEVDNVTGTATGSQIAGMEGLNTIRIYNSTLESTVTDKTASDPIADGIIIYQSTSGDAESSTGDAALFEASNSTLKSAIESGSMFYFTNTTANVVLSNTTLDFDSTKANLIVAAGNDDNGWGTAGSNGATVNFTGLNETLTGDIEVDTISTLGLYLLDGTTYTGAISITDNENATGTTDAPATVNVDDSSKWVVTADSTVSNLNVADGGQVVDEDGKTVTIVADGETVVDGDSDLTVTVTGKYSTTVETSEINELSTDDAIDRSDFDDYYGTSTTFGSVGTDASGSKDSEESKGSDSDSDSKLSTGKIVTIAGIAAVVLCAGSAITYNAIKKKQE